MRIRFIDSVINTTVCDDKIQHLCITEFGLPGDLSPRSYIYAVSIDVQVLMTRYLHKEKLKKKNNSISS